MNARQLERFRKRLTDELVAIFRLVHGDIRAGLAGDLFDDQSAARDEVDESQRVQLRDLTLSLAEGDARRAQAIEAALRRITRGEFGVCVDCGNDIGMERLRTIPWASRCVDDQEAMERESRAHIPRL